MPDVDLSRFWLLYESLSSRVSASTMEFFEELFTNDECALAVEVLCDQLYDAGLTLEPEESAAVQQLGHEWGVDTKALRLLTGGN